MPQPAPDQLPFEKVFRDLETVVDKLEQGNLPLDESLELFQYGMSLARVCGEMLDRAELKVKELSSQPGGELLIDFEIDEDDE